MTSFKKAVFRVVRSIRPGKTLSYKEVAERAGYPGAYRAVGAVLKTNKDPAVPCHRVIKADGSLGGYNGGVAQKKTLLEIEKE